MENYKFDPKLIPPVPYNKMDCLITARLLEPKDSDNSLKNLYEKFIRNSGVNWYGRQLNFADPERDRSI